MESKKHPLVSIIMPMHNSEATIERAVNSVLSQLYENWELLIVDDASKDGSINTAQRFGVLDPRINVHELEQQSGAGIARNTAIEKAKGRFIAFLDSDDEWLPEKLSQQIPWMLANDIAFSCTAYYRQKRGREKSIVHVPPKATRAELLKNNIVATLTAVYDVSQLEKCYMSEIKRRQDYGLWLDLLIKTDAVWCLDNPLSIYHVGKGTLSSNKAKAAMSQWKFFREQQNLSMIESAYYFVHYAINATRRNM